MAQLRLVTLERARTLTGDLDAVTLPEDLNEATKLTVYLGRQERVYRVPAFIAVCDLLHRRGIAGATALLGVDGTSARPAAAGRVLQPQRRDADDGHLGRLRRADQPGAAGIGRTAAPPAADAGTRNHLQALRGAAVRPSALPGTGETGMALWHKLMVYTSAAAQFHGQPIHRAIVRRLRVAGISGATTVRGVWGFRGDHTPHGDRLLQLGRHVPAVTIVVDTPDRIAEAFAAVDELTAEQGLVTSETVPATRAGAAGPAVSPAP
jgi:PII-like signaling protein